MAKKSKETPPAYEAGCSSKTEKDAENPSSKFSKVQFLQNLGLLSRRYNHETSKFERSLVQSLVAYLSLLSKFLLSFKIFCSSYLNIPKTHIIQLYLGRYKLVLFAVIHSISNSLNQFCSMYNYLPDSSKVFIAAAAFISGCWAVSFHLAFHMNSKNDYRLFKFWMKLTMELPVKSDRDYRVAGLSQEANKKFWTNENRLNKVWCRWMNWYTIFLSLTFSTQLFFVRFDEVEFLSPTYIAVQSLHVVNTIHGMSSWIHCLYTLSLFYVTCMRFFCKRFANIARHLERMSLSTTFGRADIHELSRLIIDHNQVHHDLMLINEFFKCYLGFNFIWSFAVNVVTAFFMLLDIGWRLKLALFTVIFFIYLCIICFPFLIASSVENEFNKAKREFEKIALYRPVHRAIKLKIEAISSLSETAGFTCFDWFLLDTSAALVISLEFVSWLFLMIDTYYYT